MEAEGSVASGIAGKKTPSWRRRWGGSLTLSATAAIVAVVWWDCSAREQKQAVETVRTLHGKVGYADDLPFQGPNAAVRWLQTKLGHDYTSTVFQVNLGGQTVTGKDLQCLTHLPGLRAIWLHGTSVGDAEIQVLSNCTHLEELSLRDTRITDAGLAPLGRLERLEFLYLQDNDLTDAGLVHLDSLRSLKLLKLDGTRVTSRGVRKLQRANPLAQISY